MYLLNYLPLRFGQAPQGLIDLLDRYWIKGQKERRNFRTAKKAYIQKVMVHNVGRFHTLYYFRTMCTSVVLPHIMEIMFTFEKKIRCFVETV